jgi:hypothetical protein
MSRRPRAVACTVVARNYLPYARVLGDGWRHHHPDVPLRVLLIDEDAPPPGAHPDLIGAAAVEEADGELARLRGIYTPAELATALKPRLLRLLLHEGADVVLFLDADNDVHADVRDVVPLADRHGIVLSPHLLTPPPPDGRSPGEIEQQRTGIFNSGFLAVGRSSRPFLDWWAQRVRLDCLFSDAMGAHADQLWLDFVPSYFDHHVLRDPGVNVAVWNVHERRIACVDGTFTVDGAPLRTFHFAGFDPSRPMQPSTYAWATPLRCDPATQPDLVRLCRAYGAKLVAAGIAQARRESSPFSCSAGGSPMGTWRRRAYRELLIAAEAQRVELPDPYEPARSAEFEAMLADPVATGLLSDAAQARLADLWLLERGVGRGLRGRARDVAHGPRQLARRGALWRHGWTPHPLPSDRTRREYS